MPKENETPRTEAVRRVFMAQLGIITILTILFFTFYALETPADKAAGVPEGRTFGFFWFAFLAGAMGASISLLRRVQTSRSVARDVGASWVALGMPMLYGAIMAAVAYLLFMSRILAGENNAGLLSSNLFPNFTTLDAGETLSVGDFVAMRPVDLPDLGKLMVWSFIAGYSEQLVTGILGQLERRGGTQDEARSGKKSRGDG